MPVSHSHDRSSACDAQGPVDTCRAGSASNDRPEPVRPAGCCGGETVRPSAPEAACCGPSAPAEPDEPEASWLPVGLAAVVAGQSMVFGLAVNLTPPAFGSAAYQILHGWLLLSALLVLALLLAEPLQGIRQAWQRRRLSVEALFVLTALGALVGSIVSSFTGTGSVYYEVVAIVLVIYAVGRRVGERSRRKVLAEARQLRSRFERAQVVTADGSVADRPVEAVQAGDRVRVQPGEAIPVDGRVVAGEAFIDEKLVRGELLPRVRRSGDAVWAGSLSVDGRLEIETTGSGGSRQLDAVLEALDQAGQAPSHWESQADRITQVFLPVVAATALGTGIVWAFLASWSVAVFNAMAVLLVACPCALGLAVPIGVWTGLWRLAEAGLVSREARLLDALARTRHIFFDKTGTVSGPRMQLVDWLVPDEAVADRRERGRLIRGIESRLAHPVAAALAEGLESHASADSPGNPDDAWSVAGVRAVPGKGLAAALSRAGYASVRLRIGSGAWVGEAARRQLDQLAETGSGSAGAGSQRVYAATESGEPWAIFLLRETPRPRMESLLGALTRAGIQVSIISGDPDPAWAAVGGVTVAGNLSPREKAERVAAARERGEHPVVLGDGINDLAAMAAAEAGIALNDGMTTVQVAATGVAAADALHRMPDWLAIAGRVARRMRGNLKFALCYNGIGMTLAALGLLHPVVAALLMAGSSLLVSVRAGQLPEA